MNNTRRALATDFGVWLAMSDLHKLSDEMIKSPQQWAALANYLLLYDQIVIPTGNLQVLPVLRIMLGDLVFDELIRSKTIVLARYDQWFGYAGGGAGLSFFQIKAGPLRVDGGHNLGMAHFLPLDHAIEVAIDSTNPQCSNTRRKELNNLLLDNVIEIPLAHAANKLVEETHKDIRDSPWLRELLNIKGDDLRNLGSMPGNKLSVFDPHLSSAQYGGREVRAVLRAAFDNFLLHTGSTVGATDITGDNSTWTLLRAKGQRFGRPLEGQKAFAQIQEISGVPDLGEAFFQKRLTPAQIVALRDSKHGENFRSWFSSGAPYETATETVRRFSEEVSKSAPIETSKAKVLRFVATNAIGLFGPVAGAVASAVDSFVLSSWLPGKSPRLFLKQAKVLLAQKETNSNEPRGRDRNKPCYCGSGDKYKHCHGRL